MLLPISLVGEILSNNWFRSHPTLKLFIRINSRFKFQTLHIHHSKHPSEVTGRKGIFLNGGGLETRFPSLQCFSAGWNFLTFFTKTPDGPFRQGRPNLKADLHTLADEGSHTLSHVAKATSKLSPSAFHAMYLPGTLLMDRRRYHNNNISHERRNLLEKQSVNSFLDYTPIVRTPNKTSNSSTQHVVSHEMSKPSKAVLIAD